jgi:hypothetical protein
MSLNRYAKQRDLSEPDIIEALEEAGFDVYPLDYPVDLLVRKDDWAPGIFKMLEVKTIHEGRRKELTDKRQESQRNFIASTGTPIVRTPLEALKAVGAVT